MLNTAIEESKNISKETRYSSIEQLKIFLKSQVVKKADLGEISVSENISKEINQHQIRVLSEEFKQSGYKVKISLTSDETIFSIFWD